MSDTSLAAVKSADRVLDLFELLAHAGREMSHSEIADTLQIPKSSLSQLLKNLIARGYVEVTVGGRGYRLGEALLRLAQGVGRMRDLATLSEAFLAELTSKTGESSALNLLRGDEAEVVATVLGPHRLVTHMRLGDLAPLYATSGGKAILAHLPSDFQKEYFARVQFERATPKTIHSVKVLRQEIEKIRAKGFAYSLEEWTPGIVGIGVPVLDPAGEPLGAINVAIPASRFDSEVQRKAEHALIQTRDDLLRQLLLGRPGGRKSHLLS
ncbi:IclR family transcriptional regulator [Bradyrhizobium sp. R2.2-H]|jgi:DNA-binding IclR family transcriptional regulator|uniref:IclR family transcriptional regulator n=1 Tax=unclassified Bradyrhizobium TaxID=2631580 RepID=UPI001044245F|nr:MULTISPECIES: IclR family transcriptional regulator [unclassified Bradyrhizobium]TCU72660.1 IclR family transcriptional regulator [Bradyrhizobium sp. Y-H1]TCU74780.1 IclR family transcriptional regulator [Bradyrhizobium sp. R2.2-H]